MLPLTHASEDILDELRAVQMNVGNVARVADDLFSCCFLLHVLRHLSLFRLSFSAVVSIRATWIGATTFQNPAYAPRKLLNCV